MSKHILITGSGSGLGLGLATRYLSEGATVSVLDLRVSKENRARLDAAVTTGSWTFYKIDITKIETVAKAVTAAMKAHGKIELAINSAGVGFNATLVNTSAEQFERVIRINLIGSFNFSSVVLPKLEKGARFALVASLAGLVSNYGYTAYGASKFGVVGLATTFKYEYEPRGIGITCICPPEVETPMVEEERASGDPIALELKGIAGCMDVDEACDQIKDGVDAGKWLVIPSPNAKATAAAARVAPTAFFKLTQQLVKRAMKKHGV